MLGSDLKLQLFLFYQMNAQGISTGFKKLLTLRLAQLPQVSSVAKRFFEEVKFLNNDMKESFFQAGTK